MGILKKFSALFVLGLLIVACGGGDGSSSNSSNNKPVATQKGPNGKKIFKVNCIVCHGLDGKMGVNGAKDLSLSTMTLDEKITLIENGKNTMTPFKSLLSKEEIRAVAEYTDTFKK